MTTADQTTTTHWGDLLLRGDAREMPDGWDAASIDRVVCCVVSGDWGKGDATDALGWVRCQVVRGTDFRRVQARDFAQVPVRHLRSSSIDKRRLQPDDLLVEVSGGSKHQPTGRIMRVTPEMLSRAHLPVAFTNFVKLLRVDTDMLEPSFFELFWNHVYEAGRTRIYEKRTTGIRNFKYREFMEHEVILLPPLPEQRAIAHVLRTVQRAKEATEAVIAAARELKRSLMRHLFTYGPVPLLEAERVALKETEIGPVPEHWTVVPLGKVSHGTQYGLSKRGQREGMYPILRMNNLHDGQVLPVDLQYVDLDQAAFSKFQLHNGDILFNRTNSYELVGKTALFDLLGDYVHASYLIRVVVDSSQAEPRFLNYYMNAGATQARLKSLATRAVSQSNINATKLRGFAVPLPPIREQRVVTNTLEAVTHKIEAEEKRRSALEGLFRSLLHQLMSGRVRLDPPPC